MPESDITEIWVYLSASPLLGLTVTLSAYVAAQALYVRSRYHPLLSPVVTSVTVLIALLSFTRTSYDAYFQGGQFVHFLLGPATVALAIPLYQQITKLKTLWLPVLVTLLFGAIAGGLSSMAIAWVFGASLQTQLSLAPKSVTAPVAMGISEQIGGLPSLTAALVVITGIFGAAIGVKVFELLRISDDSIKGIAMGITAHGIGTARAFQESAEMGAFSGLAMALSALFAAVALPGLLHLVAAIPTVPAL